MKKILIHIKTLFNYIKKLFNFTTKYNCNFSEVNQPCYDKNGNFIGWFSRSMAVSAFIYCKDKNGVWNVLASERGVGTPDFQGYWNCVCGYLDFGETTRAAAARELREETGVVIDESELTFIGYEDSPSANHQNVTFRFYAKIAGKTIEEFSSFSKKENEKDEVGKISWIPINDIDKFKWAFGHEKRIIEIAEKIEII